MIRKKKDLPYHVVKSSDTDEKPEVLAEFSSLEEAIGYALKFGKVISVIDEKTP